MSVGRGTIVGVTTLLLYLVIAALVGLVLFFLAVFVFGRGEQMAPLDPRTSPAELPDSDITAQDVRGIRFALALRGYRMSDVDWTLERVSEQLDQLHRENAQLRRQVHGEPEDRAELVFAGAPSDSLRSAGAPPDETAPLPLLAPAGTAQFAPFTDRGVMAGHDRNSDAGPAAGRNSEWDPSVGPAAAGHPGPTPGAADPRSAFGAQDNQS